MNEGGKGCKPRPFSVTQDEYDNRWDAIFNKNKEDKKEVVENTEEKKSEE